MIPETMTPRDVAKLLPLLPQIEAWLKAVYREATVLAAAGKLPGYKMIEGRTYREWADPAAVLAALRKAGHKDADTMSPAKLLGLGAIEKLLPKTKREKFMERYTASRRGSPQLVPASDKRPAFKGDVLADFADDIDE